MWSLICLLWQLHGALSTREHDLKVGVNQIFKPEVDFLEEQLKRLRSWKTVVESVKQRAESAIQTSGRDELHICILNAKSELENALESKPEPGKRDKEPTQMSILSATDGSFWTRFTTSVRKCFGKCLRTSLRQSRRITLKRQIFVVFRLVLAPS